MATNERKLKIKMLENCYMSVFHMCVAQLNIVYLHHNRSHTDTELITVMKEINHLREQYEHRVLDESSKWESNVHNSIGLLWKYFRIFNVFDVLYGVINIFGVQLFNIYWTLIFGIHHFKRTTNRNFSEIYQQIIHCHWLLRILPNSSIVAHHRQQNQVLTLLLTNNNICFT